MIIYDNFNIWVPGGLFSHPFCLVSLLVYCGTDLEFAQLWKYLKAQEVVFLRDRDLPLPGTRGR